MYNGVGVSSARGSGTNGYVQRNRSLVRNLKHNVSYKNDDKMRKAAEHCLKDTNPEIKAHARKREVEVKCLELEELLIKEGKTSQEVKSRVEALRAQLKEQNEEKSSEVKNIHDKKTKFKEAFAIGK